MSPTLYFKNNNLTEMNTNITLYLIFKQRLSFTFNFAQTLGDYKINIFISTSLKFDPLNRKLYVNIDYGLNPEIPILSKSVDHYLKLCKQRLSYQITHSTWKL